MDNFCTGSAPIWKFAGQIVGIFKIVIPVILIIIGVIALGKAVIQDDAKEIKTAVNSFIKKLVVAVVIFLLPTLVKVVFGLVDTFSEVPYIHCIECIENPNNC